MINTGVYLKYQAYGQLHKTLMEKSQEINNVQRPAVSTVIRLLGDAAAQRRQNYPRVTINPVVGLAELFEHKMQYDRQEKYLYYISDVTEENMRALKELDRPTRGKIRKTLQNVLNNVVKNLLMVYQGGQI